jgi:hypothetical protein
MNLRSPGVRIALDSTLRSLLTDVSAGIRVLHSRDGVPLSEQQILERARNIVMGLIGNYRIESLEGESSANSNGTPPGASDRAPVAARAATG